MKLLGCLLPCCLFLLANAAFTNKLMTIGILAQPSSVQMKLQYYHPSENWTYVAGSYVDWVGSSGAMPVLIPFDIDKDKLDAILETIDGFLLPGGGADLIRPDNTSLRTAYQLSADYITEWAMRRNDQGKFFPVFGTCLGLENFIITFANTTAALECDLDDEHVAHSVQPNEDFAKSRFWTAVGIDKARHVFETDSVYYTHSCGIRPATFAAHKGLNDSFTVLGLSSSKKGVPFVALIEHKKYPFVANQWHPEKTLFERNALYDFVDRSDEAADLMRAIILKFVAQIRQKGAPRESKDIPAFVKQFFASNRVAEALQLSSFERVYTFQRYRYFK